MKTFEVLIDVVTTTRLTVEALDEGDAQTLAERIAHVPGAGSPSLAATVRASKLIGHGPGKVIHVREVLP